MINKNFKFCLGFEFDVGIHYIGECANNTLTHTFVNQITEGQLEWAPVGDVIDKVELGNYVSDLLTSFCLSKFYFFLGF